MQAKPRQATSKGQKITDWEKFLGFAKVDGDKPQAEMAQLWEAQISERTISPALHKIGFTRKKRPTGIANGMKGNGMNF